MTERPPAPRSHIYIAGSFAMKNNRFDEGGQTWKVGHAYNILDRFIFAPDSYHKHHRKASYFPKYIWHWVEKGRSTERTILEQLKADIGSENIKGIPYPSEVTFGLDIEELVDHISNNTKTKPTFDWLKEDYDLPFKTLKSISDNDRVALADNEFARITEMVVTLSGTKFAII